MLNNTAIPVRHCDDDDDDEGDDEGDDDDGDDDDELIMPLPLCTIQRPKRMFFNSCMGHVMSLTPHSQKF